METNLRKCTMCKLDLPEDDTNFASRHDRGKKQFQSSCRECQKKYRRQHYLDNKQKYIDEINNTPCILLCANCHRERHEGLIAIIPKN
jgi:hypothetical protein